MKTTKFISVAILAMSLSFFTSCNKEETTDAISSETTTTVEEDEAITEMAEGVIDDLDAITASTDELKGASVENETCVTPSITYPEQTAFPRVITLDFGDGCESNYFNRVRKGKIIITQTAPHWEVGATRTVTFENFSVNDNQIEGSRVLTNEGLNDSEQYYFSVSANLTITTIDDFEVVYTASKTRTIVSGADTKNIWDDEFFIEGTMTTSNLYRSVNRTTTTPIYKKRICRFPVSGTLKTTITKGDKIKIITLDYGDGECDAIATASDENGNSKEITLGRKFQK